MKTERTKNFRNIASLVAENTLVQESSSYSFLSCIRPQALDIKEKTTNFVCAASTGLISCKNAKSLNSESETQEHYRADNTTKTPLKLIIGIDPGISGAIAFVSEGKFIAVYDLPTIKIKSKNGTKNRIDLESFSLLIDSYSKDVLTAFIEEVGQIGTKADPFSSFVFGFSTGLVHGVLGAFSIPINTIRPNIWKAFLGLDSDKNKSMEKAIRLFPEAAKHLTRKMDHGRAEALLIAYFAWKLSGAKK